MEGFFKFMASTNGRVVRVIAGLILIAIGWLAVTGAASWILAIIGLVPLLAGIFDFCVFAPLAGLSFKGAEIRAKK